MKTYKGTQKTAKGSYLNLKSWDFTQVEANDDVLPGEMTATYLKVPTPVAAVAGPIIGMVFLIFLPFIGIVGFLGFIAFKVYAGFKALGRTMAQGVVYRWQPGRAYFTRESKRDEGEHKPDEELDVLQEELERRKENDAGK